jgi:hypothetical protein
MTERACTGCGGPFAQHLFFEEYCPACEGTARFVGATVLRPPTDVDPDGLTPEQRAIVDRIDGGEDIFDVVPDAKPVKLRFAPGVRLRRTTEREPDELRALLAPLMDDPLEACPMIHGYGAYGWRCRFCKTPMLTALDQPSPTRDGGRERHEPTCPVLRRDALLGRATGGSS